MLIYIKSPLLLGLSGWGGTYIVLVGGGNLAQYSIARIEIGEVTVVGSGSLVLKNLPSDVLAYGNPAKIIKTRQKGNHSRAYGGISMAQTD